MLGLLKMVCGVEKKIIFSAFKKPYKIQWFCKALSKKILKK